MESRDVVTCRYCPVKGGLHSYATGGSRRDRGWKGPMKPSYARHLTQDQENAGLFMPHWDGLVVTMETKAPSL